MWQIGGYTVIYFIKFLVELQVSFPQQVVYFAANSCCKCSAASSRAASGKKEAASGFAASAHTFCIKYIAKLCNDQLKYRAPIAYRLPISYRL